MDKKIRRHTDIKIAFGATFENQIKVDQNSVMNPAPLPEIESPITFSQISFRQKIKNILKIHAAFLFRLSKPFLRPIFFRLRRYFLNPFTDELNNLSNRVNNLITEQNYFNREFLLQQNQLYELQTTIHNLLLEMQEMQSRFQ